MAESVVGTIKGSQPPPQIQNTQQQAERLPLGPIKIIHVFWLAGMSCDGCTIAVAGATNPGYE